MIKSTKAISFWILAAPTIVLFYASLFLTIRIRYPLGLDSSALQNHLRAFTIMYILWVLIFFSHRLFDLTTLRRYTKVVFTLFSAMCVNLLAAIIYFYFQPNLILTPRRFLLLDVGISFGLVLIWYLLVKYFFNAGRIEKVYLFSFNRELEELEKEIQKHAFLGFRVLGHLNDQTLDNLAHVEKVSVILPVNLPNSPQTLAKFYELRKRGVTFYNYHDFYENLLRRVFLSQVSEVWLLENIDYKEKPLYHFFKRFIDIVFAFLMFIIFLLTFPFIYVFIKLTSSGPVFFVQERVGKYGNMFQVYKYRTMNSGVVDTWTEKNDPRITSFGKFLRKSRLDELPQFINLFKGNMSLVGPRPEQVQIVETLRAGIPFYDERTFVKPGITGWGQLNVYAATTEESKLKLQYDLYYIKHRSFMFDLEIILKTAYYIFTGSGR
jgi:exopolysaccharide biosynthesis polyprenyl glycosylphosphotransferase